MYERIKPTWIVNISLRKYYGPYKNKKKLKRDIGQVRKISDSWLEIGSNAFETEDASVLEGFTRSTIYELKHPIEEKINKYAEVLRIKIEVDKQLELRRERYSKLDSGINLIVENIKNKGDIKYCISKIIDQLTILE